jgi:MFS family permease
MITYRGLELNATATTIGFLGAIYALLPVLLAVFFGRAADKFGEKQLLIFGATGILISSLFLRGASSLAELAVFTAMAGVAHLAVMVGGQTMVSRKSPSEYYDKYFGYYTFSASFGQMIGPLLGGLVAGSAGTLPKSTTNAFTIAAVLAIIGVIPLILTKSEKINQSNTYQQKTSKVKVSSLLTNKGISSAIFTSLIISSASDILVVFLPLFGQEKNFTPAVVGLLLSLRAGMAMISRFFLGNLSERFTARNVMISSGLLSAVSCGLLFFGDTVILIAFIIAVAGFALGIGQPLTMAWVSRSSKIDERAMAISLRLTGNRLGQFGLPLIAGVTASTLGVGSVFLVLSGMLGVSTLVSVRNFQGSERD